MPPESKRDLRPGHKARTVHDADGAILEVPPGWELLPPGDAGLTRKVMALGPTWGVSEKVGRRSFSRGLWADADQIARARATVEATRSTPSHQRKLEAGRRRRELEQADYVGEFERSVIDFLRFHPRHADVEAELARRVAVHATPVGSGTVARTRRIPIERRAEAAVIAWLRHHTTGYDDMYIQRIKGERREVRRELAERSRALLHRYRRGEDAPPDCPLARALEGPGEGPRTPNRAGAEPGTPETPPRPHPAAPGSTSTPPVGTGTAPRAAFQAQSDREAAQQALYEKVRARLTAKKTR